MKYQASAEIGQLLTNAQHVVIVQADNPDADSLGSTLALEAILSEQGKKVSLYCPVDMPGYIKYLSGWDRVSYELPNGFDLAIFVDVSTYSLLEKAKSSGHLSRLLSKPAVVLDHHANVEQAIDAAKVIINDSVSSSTGEVIFNLAEDLDWQLPTDSLRPLMASILGDTQGLTNSLATANTYTIMSKLVSKGADRPTLEEDRRELSKMPEIIYKYKAELIKRTKFSEDKKTAYVTVGQDEINKYSPLYNPAPLIQNDMLQVEGVKLAIVFKTYDDGRITGAIRSLLDAPIAGNLATLLGGGGHELASGFKVTETNDFDKIINKVLAEATKLLNDLKDEN